ncbi:2OG-Fe(II) oxygenase [Lysobacter sp. S4-A87]|uniref:2OG-Fe(II) oxygenase n=1 Tax=Lysobacter sp. S4-A87 TaxID=2925843 RepID=UPI001F530309|nr:2OG-Fe(II) oxygenase [Lysobacter sp. S4-A87]UNK48458.1 2OG-Fe(II) oxygenase [Lysobacter sp. S4-A87]
MNAVLQQRWNGDGLAQRIDWVDWPGIRAQLDAHGCARIPALLDQADCDAIAGLYDHPGGFRSTVTMARHGFGRGEYRYFSYPLPATVAALRTAIYPHLVAIANRWNEAMAINARYPDEHARFIDRCHEAGQTRPTPLLLRYDKGDYNCLHQDVYGEHLFPLQLVVLLSQPHRDFEGGELVLTEQRPRMQSRAEVVPLQQGDGVVFAVRERPVTGARGSYRVRMRHGVSRIHSGRRHTLGVIFHDAL